MKRVCNIDARGARVRRIWGLLCLLAAAGLAFVAFRTGSVWLWVAAAFAVAAALFAFWEARHKWCAVRALGIKTPL